MALAMLPPPTKAMVALRALVKGPPRDRGGWSIGPGVVGREFMGEKWVKSRVLAALKDGCRLLGVIGAEPQSVGKNAHRLVWDYLFKWAPQCTNEKRGVDAGSKIIHNRGLCSKKQESSPYRIALDIGFKARMAGPRLIRTMDEGSR